MQTPNTSQKVKLKVLVIDDNPADANILCRYLEDLQFWDVTYKVCTDLDCAEQAYVEHNPSIVFVDYYLGKLTGIELIRLLRVENRNADFILLTGQSDEKTAIAAVRESVSDYVIKNELSNEVLDRVLRHIYENRTAKQAVEQAYDELEKRVKERTASLKLANQQLKLEILERRKAEIALRENEKRLSTILETAAEGIITTDNTGIIHTVNQATNKLFGYTDTELKGMYIGTIVKIPDEATKNTGNSAENENMKFIQTYDAQGIRKDGSSFPLHIAVSELYIDDKQMFTSLVSDYSEKRVAEKKLLEAKEKAIEANKAKSQFISQMSHEFRTPLNAILGFAQLLKLDVHDNSDLLSSVLEIESAGTHLLSLMNEVLDLSRIEAGKSDFDLQEVELKDIVDESHTLVNHMFLQNQISFINKISQSENTTVMADPLRLKQVMVNLLSNAIKYNRHQGTVTVSLLNTSEASLLSVQDTGAGLSQEDQEKVFDPFCRLQAESSDIEGYGIGLTICKKLIEKMGGVITVSSRIGEGTCFTVKLNNSLLNNRLEDLSTQPLKAQGQN